VSVVLTPITFDCPICAEAVELPGRLCLLEADPPSGCDILLDLDAARAHAKSHGGERATDDALASVMSAALARFGISY
jgi:hypothetical protein